MKILILNWRSIKDPLSGGAEVATLEHAKRWVKNHGAQVTWLSPIYNPDIKEEVIEGVNFKYIGLPLIRDSILQMAISYPVFFISVIYTYFKYFRNKVDVVIDQSHGLPYLTPFYVKEKKILYIHEVADSIWDKMFPFPISSIGKFSEKILLKFYSNQIIVAGSNSTRNDVLKLGIDKKNITVVEYGVKLPDKLPNLEKEKEPTLLYVNRLVKMKGPERAIEIFNKFNKEYPNSKLWMIGKGDEDYVQELNNLVNKLNLKGEVTFFGFVSEEMKFELFNRANIYINTSYKEGWGLGNIEANSVGTPAVGFAAGGNVDSIKNGVSGFTVDTEEQFLEKLKFLMENDYSKSARDYSKLFDWEKKSNEFWNIIKK